MEDLPFSRKQLEIALESVTTFSKPRVKLEQYTISTSTAAEILFIAGYLHNDIKKKTVLDLGCGTGRLTIGAALLEAKEVIGVDIDHMAIQTARECSKKMDIQNKITWIVSGLDSIKGRFDTIIQNPPFGVKKKGADRIFIKKALEIGNVIYSLHKSGKKNREFIKSMLSKHKSNLTDLYQMTLRIPHTFKFHTKREYVIPVDLYRVVTHASE